MLPSYQNDKNKVPQSKKVIYVGSVDCDDNEQEARKRVESISISSNLGGYNEINVTPKDKSEVDGLVD